MCRVSVATGPGNMGIEHPGQKKMPAEGGKGKSHGEMQAGGGGSAVGPTQAGCMWERGWQLY